MIRRSTSAARRAGIRAMTALAEGVAEFNVFHEHTKGYFDIEGKGEESEREFLEKIAAPEVGECAA